MGGLPVSFVGRRHKNGFLVSHLLKFVDHRRLIKDIDVGIVITSLTEPPPNVRFRDQHDWCIDEIFDCPLGGVIIEVRRLLVVMLGCRRRRPLHFLFDPSNYVSHLTVELTGIGRKIPEIFNRKHNGNATEFYFDLIHKLLAYRIGCVMPLPWFRTAALKEAVSSHFLSMSRSCIHVY